MSGMTKKQSLLAHIDYTPHAGEHPSTRDTLVQIRKWHTECHMNHTNSHTHGSHYGFDSGADIQPVAIYLAPPRNPQGTNRKDRNWTLVVSRTNIVDYHDLAGTSVVDPEAAKHIANGILGYEAEWVENGIGWRLR